MRIPGGAHTHGSGGSGLGTALLVLVGVALAVKLAGPVLGAVGELVHVLLVAVFIIAGAGAAGVVTLLTLKWRGARADAARIMPPLRQQMVRAASPLPQERRAAQLPAESQRELPGGLHLHFHGVTAEDIAAILDRRDDL